MDVRHYPVIIERAEDSDGAVGLGAFFPDLPGCVSAGDTLDETLVNAGEALSMHVAAMVRDGDPLPVPTLLETIPRDPDVDEVLRTLVRVEIPARWVRVNITMAETLLQRVDALSRQRGMTRSGFLAEAARRMAESG